MFSGMLGFYINHLIPEWLINFLRNIQMIRALKYCWEQIKQTPNSSFRNVFYVPLSGTLNIKYFLQWRWNLTTYFCYLSFWNGNRGISWKHWNRAKDRYLGSMVPKILSPPLAEPKWITWTVSEPSHLAKLTMFPLINSPWPKASAILLLLRYKEDMAADSEYSKEFIFHIPQWSIKILLFTT